MKKTRAALLARIKFLEDAAKQDKSSRLWATKQALEAGITVNQFMLRDTIAELRELGEIRDEKWPPKDKN